MAFSGAVDQPFRDGMMRQELCSCVVMMHQCSADEYSWVALRWCIMPTLQEVINPINAALTSYMPVLHSCIMTTEGNGALHHCATV